VLYVAADAPATAQVECHARLVQLGLIETAATILARRLEAQPFGEGVGVPTNPVPVEGGDGREVEPAGAAEVYGLMFDSRVPDSRGPAKAQAAHLVAIAARWKGTSAGSAVPRACEEGTGAKCRCVTR